MKKEVNKNEIIEHFLEKLFSLEVREKDFIFQGELERLSKISSSWEEEERLYLELKALAEERGFRII